MDRRAPRERRWFIWCVRRPRLRDSIVDYEADSVARHQVQRTPARSSRSPSESWTRTRRRLSPTFVLPFTQRSGRPLHPRPSRRATTTCPHPPAPARVSPLKSDYTQSAHLELNRAAWSESHPFGLSPIVEVTEPASSSRPASSSPVPTNMVVESHSLVVKLRIPPALRAKLLAERFKVPLPSAALVPSEVAQASISAPFTPDCLVQDISTNCRIPQKESGASARSGTTLRRPPPSRARHFPALLPPARSRTFNHSPYDLFTHPVPRILTCKVCPTSARDLV